MMNRTIATIMTVFVAMVLIATAVIPVTSDMIGELKYVRNSGSVSYTEVTQESETVTYTFLEDGGVEADGVRIPGLDTTRTHYTPLVICETGVLAVGEGTLVRLGVNTSGSEYSTSVAAYTRHDPGSVTVTPAGATINHNTDPVIHETFARPLVEASVDGPLTLVEHMGEYQGARVLEDTPVYLWDPPADWSVSKHATLYAYGTPESMTGRSYDGSGALPGVSCTPEITLADPQDGVYRLNDVIANIGGRTIAYLPDAVVPKEIPRESDQPAVTLLGVIPLMVIIGLLLVVVRGMTGSGGFSRSEGGGDTYEDF